jgi:hypothetical protein
MRCRCWSAQSRALWSRRRHTRVCALLPLICESSARTARRRDEAAHLSLALICGVEHVQTTAGQVSMDMNGLDEQEDEQEGSSDMEADDEDDKAAPKLVASTSSKRGAAVDLYAADGQYNPKAAKKAKKEAKKLSALGLKPTPAGGVDYDFATDFAPTDDQMVSGDEEEEEEEEGEEGDEEEDEDEDEDEQGSEEEGSGDDMDD